MAKQMAKTITRVKYHSRKKNNTNNSTGSYPFQRYIYLINEAQYY